MSPTHGSRLNDRVLTTAAPDLPRGELSLPVRARRREMVGRLGLLAADMLSVAGSMLVVAVLSGARVTVWGLVLLPLYALLAKMAGLYDRDQFVLAKTTLDEAPRLVAVAATFALIIEGVQALEFTGRSQPLVLWGMLSIALVGGRAAARFLTVRATGTERVLVVGDALATTLIKRKLAADPGLNAEVVGRVSVESAPGDPPDKVLGSVEELPEVLERHCVERVIVAPRHEGGEDVVDVVRLATACGVRVAVLPRLLEVIGTSVEFDDLGGQVLLGVRGFGLSPSSRFLKRVFDLIVTALLLVVLAPLLLMIAIAVKFTSSGPVFFRQTRIGRHGDEIQVLKFRTMVDDADERKQDLLEHNEAAPLFKIVNDPRTTPVGRFLRRWYLDELPQLVNVMRGDMSLVGPRPLVTDEDRLFSGWQRRRYHVSPGITGPWQILGSSRVPIGDMVTIDYLYCANWSLWLDAKILARTIPYVLSRAQRRACRGPALASGGGARRPAPIASDLPGPGRGVGITTRGRAVIRDHAEDAGIERLQLVAQAPGLRSAEGVHGRGDDYAIDLAKHRDGVRYVGDGWCVDHHQVVVFGQHLEDLRHGRRLHEGPRIVRRVARHHHMHGALIAICRGRGRSRRDGLESMGNLDLASDGLRESRPRLEAVALRHRRTP